MKNLLFIVLATVVLSACNSENEELPTTTGNGIFPETQILEIDTLSGPFNFPTFDLNDPDLPDHLYIAVFDEPIVVENRQIKNKDAIIWEWNFSMEQVGLVTFNDGNSIDSTYILSELTCGDVPVLYWAAWAWDENIQYITHATVQHAFRVVPDQLPSLIIEQIDLVGEASPDGYLQAGEQITLKAVVKNEGQQAAEAITATLYSNEQARIVDLPISHEISSIEGGGFKDVYFTFKLPNGLGIEEILDVNIDLKYSDCLSSPPVEHQLTITGRQICLNRITLVEIRSSPPEGAPYWDHWLQIGYWNPDPYYLLSEEDNDLDLIRSEVLQEVPVNNPLEKVWSPLDPCKSLKLDKIYTIQVYDKDYNSDLIDNADDYIGDVQFVPKDFLDTNESTRILESSSIVVKLELVWQ
ncbi:MAG: CARDB domain-containing protein [Bacteroidota bacterium]